MKRYWLTVALLLLLFLSIFLVSKQSKPSLLTYPLEIMNARSIGVAMVGIGLLVADVILPVPSSLVMAANGVQFGLVIGTLLSLLGVLGAAHVGFAIGRWSEPWIARYVTPDERLRAQYLIDQWGMLAIILTRPVPLLAETTVIMAGASKMPWQTMSLAALIGSLPVALLFTAAGATAAHLDNPVLTFGIVLIISGVFWGLNKYFYINRISRHR